MASIDSDIDVKVRDAVVDLLAAAEGIAEVSAGTTTSTTASKLVDSAATFITDGVAVGDIVKNNTDATETTVSAVDSQTTLSVASDIFTSGETYTIYKPGVYHTVQVKGFREELKAEAVPMIGVEVEEIDTQFHGNVQLGRRVTVSIHCITASDQDQDGDEARALRGYVVAAMNRTDTIAILRDQPGLYIWPNQGVRAISLEDNSDENDNGRFTVKTAVYEITATLFDEDAFITIWDTTKSGTSTSTQITIPTVSSGSYDCVVTWGDGTTSSRITSYSDSAWTHSYSAENHRAVVSITGTFSGFKFNNGGDKLKLLRVINCGSLIIQDTDAFYGCSNLKWEASDAPTFSASDLSRSFLNCTSLELVHALSSWDLGDSCNTAQSFFQGCTLFNSPPGTMDFGGVTNALGFFSSCTSFNKSISSIVAPSLTVAQSFLSGCTSYNQLIDWSDKTGITDFSGFLGSATAFNSTILLDWESCTTALNFNINGNMSTTVYNALLVDIQGQAVQNSVSFHGGNATHSGAGTTARTALVNTNLWTITDGGAA